MSLSSRLKATSNFKKWTFPIHVMLGLFLAAIPPTSVYMANIFGVSIPIMFAIGVILSLAVLTLFAWDEWWDDKCNNNTEGESDWWASFASYVIGLVIFFVVVIIHGILTGVTFWR